MKRINVLELGVALLSVGGAAHAALQFTPAAGYTAEVLWSGSNAAHFAIEGDRIFTFGAEPAGGGMSRNVVRVHENGATSEVAGGPAFSGSTWSPDAITVADGAVWWAQVRDFSAATVYRSVPVGDSWTTTTVLDAAAGFNVFSLSTDGQHVFGTGLDAAGENIAFHLDETSGLRVFAALEGFSGGSGFDPAGNFFAGSVDLSFVPRMHRFSSTQVADWLDGAVSQPYTPADAVGAWIVPGNGSAVMESDGGRIFGAAFDAGFSNSQPYAFDLSTGETSSLGELSGAANNLTTDLYFRDNAVVFMGKDGFGTGTEAAIYRVVPEPASAVLVLAGVLLVARRRRLHGCGTATRQSGCMLLSAAIGMAAATAAAAQSPFAAAVIDYAPAPGQFVNDPAFNDPGVALGAPLGDDPSAPNNDSVVSLGGFGGSIILAFDHTVMDDAANPFGLDAIVYGNALYVSGNPNRRWAECGVIEISRDANGNGLADDPWYLIPGSHITDPPAQHESQTWDDNVADTTYPPDDPGWIPPGESGVWTTEGPRLPSGLFDTPVLANPNGLDAVEEAVFGYADHTPVQALPAGEDPEEFYTRPDNPFAVGLTPGSGGGDGFDIAWAVDAATGEPAGLDGFDFIRITTAVNHDAGVLGEVSTEIGGVADVAEGRFGDADGNGVFDNDDSAVLLACLLGPGSPVPTSPCRVMDFTQDQDVDLADFAEFQVVFGAP